jgi:hypothetical protein
MSLVSDYPDLPKFVFNIVYTITICKIHFFVIFLKSTRFILLLYIHVRSRKPRLTALGIRCADHATPSIRKMLALTSPTSGGRSVGIVRLRTKGHGV